MTIPKQITPPPIRTFYSERHEQLNQMRKLAQKAFPEMVSLLHLEMHREECNAIREKNRRLMHSILKK